MPQKVNKQQQPSAPSKRWAYYFLLALFCFMFIFTTHNIQIGFILLALCLTFLWQAYQLLPPRHTSDPLTASTQNQQAGNHFHRASSMVNLRDWDQPTTPKRVAGARRGAQSAPRLSQENTTTPRASESPFSPIIAHSNNASPNSSSSNSSSPNRTGWFWS